MVKTKQPTKKQEREFLANLSPSQKEYIVFDCKEYVSKGNWNGVVYHKPSFIRRIAKKLYNWSGARFDDWPYHI